VHLRIENLSKQYAEHKVMALSDLSLTIDKAEFVALMGPSGCGKSTLLNLIAGIDKPSAGRIFIADSETTGMNDEQLTRFRRDKIGFVFQFFNLLSTLTAQENVALPLELAGRPAKEIKERSVSMLEKVGLGPRLNFYPSQLSGGEMQRVAVARALVHSPELIIADEPTGNLDTENGAQILDLLRELCREHKQTAIMATHSEDAAALCDRIIRMKDGRLYQAEPE
jgi:putative ABC transport system ATP-binding protein